MKKLHKGIMIGCASAVALMSMHATVIAGCQVKQGDSKFIKALKKSNPNADCKKIGSYMNCRLPAVQAPYKCINSPELKKAIKKYKARQIHCWSKSSANLIQTSKSCARKNNLNMPKMGN